jgi:hypothetical protein
MKKQKGKNGFAGLYAVLLIAAILLALIAFGAGYWLSGGSEVYYVDDEDSVEDTTNDSAGEVSIINPEYSDVQEEIQINWYSEPEEVDPLDIVKNTISSESTGVVKAYNLGSVVAQGQYNGMTLTVYTVEYMGMGEYYKSFYMLTSESEYQKPVLLDTYALDGTAFFNRYSDFESFTTEMADWMQYASSGDAEKYNIFLSGVSVDMYSTITDIENIKALKGARDANGVEFEQLGFGDMLVYPKEIDINDFDTVSEINGHTLYQVNGDEGALEDYKNLFFFVDQSGRIVVYDINIHFITGTEPTELTVYGDSTYIGNYVKYTSGGCGYGSLTNIVNEEEVGPLSWLGVIKYYGVQYDIYEPENYSMEYYLNDYNTWLAWHEGGTLEQFLALHPFLYYQDMLGRWIKLTHVDVLPQAECGKPVIYLYPEEKMQIDVELEPVGGFTYTEPVYDNGWSVIASPDGTLTNLKDGLTYPYLFWEGRGGYYQEPENYWVVEASEVESFLIGTLREYGLNDKETADFIEFWLPRMQDASYYKIGFHGTEVMNAIAPMSLSVHPDSVLRILMDFAELDAPIASNPPVIVPFEREGFTVVEWGGVIE